MVTINIKFSNRFLYTFIVLMILIVGGVCVYAVTSYTPQEYGHRINELVVPDSCSPGQILTLMPGGVLNDYWACAEAPTGTGGGAWSVDGSDIYYGSGNVGIGGQPNQTRDTNYIFKGKRMQRILMGTKEFSDLTT